MNRYSIFRRSPSGASNRKDSRPIWFRVAHANGRAEHGDVEHDEQGQAGPGGRVVEHVEAEHLRQLTAQISATPKMPSHMQVR